MISTPAAAASQGWRPQQYSDRRAATVADPLIEPLWTGPRVLALVDGDRLRVTDIDGDPVELEPPLTEELIASVSPSIVLIEAVLTPEPIQDPRALPDRDSPIPGPGASVNQMVFGARGERRERRQSEQVEARRRSTLPDVEEFGIVAVDLLWLDDEPLLDVPLLERRRLLESVVVESRLVRRGIYVRPPVDAWLGSWRSFGFSSLAYKAANSRYLPGQVNPEWAIARIPRA